MDYYPKRQTEGINYFLLFAVIFSAVLLANLLSTWIAAHVAARGIEQVAQQLESDLNRELQVLAAQAQHRSTQLALEREQQQEAIKTKRTRDATGTDLWRTCMEWSEAAVSLKSRTALEGSKAHCKRYETYIKTGRLTKEIQH